MLLARCVIDRDYSIYDNHNSNCFCVSWFWKWQPAKHITNVFIKNEKRWNRIHLFWTFQISVVPFNFRTLMTGDPNWISMGDDDNLLYEGLFQPSSVFYLSERSDGAFSLLPSAFCIGSRVFNGIIVIYYVQFSVPVLKMYL